MSSDYTVFVFAKTLTSAPKISVDKLITLRVKCPALAQQWFVT